MLTKKFGTFTLLASAIAGIVGSGWLLGPLACARIAGPAASITWLMAGMMMMIVAATFVVLTRSIPIAGGTVRFFQLSYGHFAGFTFSWIAWLAWVAVSPIETMALLQYSSTYIHGLMTSGASPILTHRGMLAAVILMTLIAAINNYGVRVYERINMIILCFKIFIPVATVVLLFSTHFHAHNFISHGGFMPYGVQSLFSALPLAGVIYSFIGFNPVIQLASEAKNPRKAIPIAIFGALLVCIVLYSLVQVAFIAALPSSSIAHGWSMLSFADDKGPFAGLLAMFGFAIFVKALYVDAAVSPFGTAVVQTMATSRLTYGMSKNGYFPSSLLKTTSDGTPRRALIMNMIVGYLFFLPFPSWQHMVGFLVSCLVFGYVIGPMSLLVVVKTHAERFSVRVRKWAHVLGVTAFYICNLMIFWSGWDVIYKVIIMFAVGYVVLFLRTGIKGSSKAFKELHILRGSWVVAYIIGLAMISYLSSFGGIHKIPFGDDFMVLAAFSLFIYALASYLARITEQPDCELD